LVGTREEAENFYLQKLKAFHKITSWVRSKRITGTENE